MGPPENADHAEIELGPETEDAAGWAYAAAVFAAGRVHRCRLSLSFADYDLWCRGQHAPSRVARAALAWLVERDGPAAVPVRLDCATLRRRFPDLDAELPGRV